MESELKSCCYAPMRPSYPFSFPDKRPCRIRIRHIQVHAKKFCYTMREIHYLRVKLGNTSKTSSLNQHERLPPRMDGDQQLILFLAFSLNLAFFTISHWVKLAEAEWRCHIVNILLPSVHHNILEIWLSGLIHRVSLKCGIYHLTITAI